MLRRLRTGIATLLLGWFFVLGWEGVELLACNTPTETPGRSVDSLHPPSSPGRAAILKTYGKLPLMFEANRGQTDERVKLLSRGPGHTVFFTPSEVVLALTQPSAHGRRTGAEPRQSHLNPVTPASLSGEGRGGGAVLRMQFVGADPQSQISGLEELSGKAHYFVGNDPVKWKSHVPTYSKVRYQGIYSGIDLVFYGNQHRLEYDFIVEPGANPDAIRLRFEGADQISLDEQGNLRLQTSVGEIVQHLPHIYQGAGEARQIIRGSYVLQGKDQVGFRVAAYDRGKLLVIDPVLSYSTFLGGSKNDSAYSIAVDKEGNSYLMGVIYLSSDFPVTGGALDVIYNGDSDVFITKLNPMGTALVYSTYLGGRSTEYGGGIAVDMEGNAFITGTTFSPNFPTTSGAFDTTLNSGPDAFVAKLDSTGSFLVYSTYLGGFHIDYGSAIAVDREGHTYITGFTFSPNFPITRGAFDTTFNGGSDAFVAKLNLAGSALVYSTFLGGSGGDYSNAIALDAMGSAYVTGETRSTDFPMVRPYQGYHGGGDCVGVPCNDAFITKLDPTGATLVYSTYLGGSRDDSGEAIAVDANGHAYVTGFTFSHNFPLARPYQGTFAGGHFVGEYYLSDAFVTKLDLTGSELVYSTYLGGSRSDNGSGIAVDHFGNAYVTGSTNSPDFPIAASVQSALRDEYCFAVPCEDVFVTKLNSAGTALIYSTYLGGRDREVGTAIAVDTLGNAYVTGNTTSLDFPIKDPYQPVNNGGFDAFVLKLATPCAGTGSHSLSGQVTSVDGEFEIAGVLLTLLGPEECSDTTMTNVRGQFWFDNLTDGTYVVTPFKVGCAFKPMNRKVKFGEEEMQVRKFIGICP